MKRLLLLVVLLTSLTKVVAVTEDSVAVRLCQEAENAYTGANGVFLNKEKAMQLYIQAVERNYIPAIHKVAGFYNRGEVVEKSMKNYLSWLTKAAEMGDADAQNRVGVCYYNGEGTKKDIKRAEYWQLKAANQGNIHAMNNLRILYFDQDNIEESLKWTRMGAEHGQIECQYELGGAYKNGKGVKEDIDQAAYWYKMAADNGHKSACNQLAVIYHNEKEDYAKALYYLNKAAELGDENAFFNLGYIYEHGNGTEKSYTKAEEYYKKALEYDNSLTNSARYRLGVIYYEGREGVKKDKKKGESLLKEAAKNGNDKAKKYLDEHKVKWTFTINGEDVLHN